ncbi:MAG: RHS repeat-associated core domain-containing protein, partial [Polyangiaceae bacterium]
QTRQFKQDLATGALLEVREPAQADGTPVTSFQIDGFGRTVREWRTFDSESGFNQVLVSETTYVDVAPRSATRRELIDQTAGGWVQTTTVLDGLNRVIREDQPSASGDAIISFVYDATGGVRKTTVPNPSTVPGAPAVVSYDREYDGLGRVLGESAPEGAMTRYVYDGPVTTVRVDATDTQTPPVKQYLHDSFGRLIQVTEGEADPATTTYGFDAQDRLVSLIDADGTATQIEFEIGGARAAVVRAGSRTEYRYDLHGNRVLAVHPNPDGIFGLDYWSSWHYDALDRVVSSTPATRGLSTAEIARYQADQPTLYVYDEGAAANGVGRLTQVVLPYGTISYDYDAQGRVAGRRQEVEVSPEGHTVHHVAQLSRTYNVAGEIILESYGDDASQPTLTRTSYDDRGRPESLAAFDYGAQSWLTLAKFSRDASGLVQKRTTPYEHVEQAYQRDALGRVVRHEVQGSWCEGASCSVGTIAGEALKFDQSGNVHALTDLASARHIDVLHDERDQIRSATAAGDQSYQAAFDYFGSGRVKTARVTSGLPAADITSRNVIYGYLQADPAAVRSLTDIASGEVLARFGYDYSGNRLSTQTDAGFTNFRYDGDDTLREVRTPDGAFELYWYDDSGQRLLTYRSARGGNPAELRHRAGSAEIFINVTGGVERTTADLYLSASPVARISDGSLSDSDLLFNGVVGSLLAVVGTDGQPRARYGYGVFGEVLYSEGPSAASYDLRFNGKPQDGISGLSYYGRRYYDPLTLTWTQADPLYRSLPEMANEDPRRYSLYAFSLNNPLRYVDPDGLDPRNTECEIPKTGPAPQGDAKKKGEDHKREEDDKKKEQQAQKELIARLWKALVQRYNLDPRFIDTPTTTKELNRLISTLVVHDLGVINRRRSAFKEEATRRARDRREAAEEKADQQTQENTERARKLIDTDVERRAKQGVKDWAKNRVKDWLPD